MENKKEAKLRREEKGITLVALIITVIILVILAAISINAVYQSKIVNYAINGTYNYAKEGLNENKVLDETTKMIDSAVDQLKNMQNPKKLTKEELMNTEMIGKYVDYEQIKGSYIATKEITQRRGTCRNRRPSF